MMDSSAPSNLAPLSEESPPAETSARDCSNNPPDHNNINDEVPSAFSSVPARPPIQTSSQKYAPLDWSGYFDREDDVSIPGSNDVFHVYLAGTQGPVIFCLHGGGYTGLSFALSASKIKEKVRVVAMDFRGHGKSSTENELDLSIETLCSDVLAVLKTMYGDSPPAIVLVGHSMGGSVAVHVAARKQLPTLCGLVVVDVVEGTAMASLIHMQKILTNRMQHFPTIEKAIEWSVKGGSLRNIESARVSIPSTLIYDDSKRCYTYTAKLEETEQHWRGWYEGLSEKFLSSPVPKLLLLAGTDRLDRALTIGQMQGKFQMVVVRHTGHAIQEDVPDEFADFILNFVSRNRIGPRGIEIPGIKSWRS
ncbi:protein phosphatase methylesterase 1 [Coffea eugenioides]|uniref:protein phosphatase methylesterase 1 n=1 Tax=Coffea eugenioides TaxID=49369 RepID=UPI000F5C3B55|nr:protein phosphatase methylesterase 1-like [Coffea arabica]XP_027150654.1 protein phosphatase methylesterase 1 [Coffea eugenioides]